MINDLGNFQQETVISNNEKEAKTNLLTLRPNSKVIEAKWVYKYYLITKIWMNLLIRI